MSTNGENTRCHPEPKPRFHVEASGHPTKPDLQGAFVELPDLAGYRWVFHRELPKEDT